MRDVRFTPESGHSSERVGCPKGAISKHRGLFGWHTCLVKPPFGWLYPSFMSASCCNDPHRGNPAYRRVLWCVLAINAMMFLVEIGAGLAAGSASLQADALDFLGDAANYAISLFVVGMTLRYRATAALLKGLTMAAFGAWVIGVTFWHAWHGTLPQAFTMGAVGRAALLANVLSFGLLWAYREGDANMRSAWVCTRNDVLGNLAVLLAALGVFGTGTGWPDVIVAAIMAGLALQGAQAVVNQSRSELRTISAQA
jgi:Co/Zn/Cd efflux system component